CIFEYIYFARPDSMMNDISVYKSRVRMGRSLAKKIEKMNLDIDVIMPVPDSSRTAALAMAEKMDLKYSEGLVKNRYIGRTFIMPGQKIRKKSIRYKLNPMPIEMKGKKILLVDDSIVRGNTSKKIIQMVREAGAKKVYFASYSPPVKRQCLYGVDVPTRDELIANDSTVEEIRKYIDADELVYQGLNETFKACIKGNPELKDLCMGCFDGEYKTGDVTKEILERTAAERSQDKEASGCDRLSDESDLMENPNQLPLV
ncbi:amidophosphoribosyltransferase, partial [Candidatus Peregrinibacteria bacterium]|nr:amidophosphoribosyltransferase [Candidatus Peregrinibacteria bacterium]